ncbi:hypothetical protein [Sphingopyxis sp.]|uniref:hypothetical protein n=1 Tax=Sphingopyxis sp. TaxID=1908224 RepID=UPI002B4961D6|nr:hypothetical protein [Sphingopyxis sp.]HJS11137.1 hypothetical protein [Sphingopyxis sp.]
MQIFREGAGRRFAELNAGIQTTHCRQDVSRRGASGRTKADELLYSVSLALKPLDWLTLYAGHSVGLEETAPPPHSLQLSADF